MPYTQVSLANEDGGQMTTWLDAGPMLRRGAVIELKKDKRMWLVQDVYDTKEDIPDHRKFDNNNYDKHTGLDI